MHQNIQQLFALLPAAKVVAYLEQHGWQPVENPNQDLAEFASPPAPNAEPCHVTLYRAESHPQFRRQLPNVIFQLCIFEDRPALDIANEMYALRNAPVADSLAAVPLAAWHRWSIQQQRPETLYVWLDSAQVAFAWEPGDRLELLSRTGTEGPRFVLRDDGIVIRGIDAEHFRAFLGCEPASSEVRPTIGQLVAQETANLTDFHFPATRDVFESHLQPIVSRIEFDLPVSSPSDGATNPDVARRQIARLAATFAKHTENAAPQLWRLALRLAGCAELSLEIHAMAIDDLWLTAQDDSAEFPRQTLAWLERHAVDPRGLTQLG